MMKKEMERIFSNTLQKQEPESSPAQKEQPESVLTGVANGDSHDGEG